MKKNPVPAPLFNPHGNVPYYGCVVKEDTDPLIDDMEETLDIIDQVVDQYHGINHEIQLFGYVQRYCALATIKMLRDANYPEH